MWKHDVIRKWVEGFRPENSNTVTANVADFDPQTTLAPYEVSRGVVFAHT